MRIALLILTLFPPLSCMAQGWSLDKCLSYALENNKELLADRYDADIHKAERRKAQSGLFPEITANAGLDYYWKVPVQTLPGELIGQSPGTFITVPTSTTYTGNYGLEMRLNLVDAQVWSKIKLETLREQAGKVEYASLEKLLSRNVSVAFYLTQQYADDYIISGQRYENQKQVHELVEKLFGEGLTDQIAFNQSLSILKSQEEIHAQNGYTLENSLTDLKFWMGYPLDSVLTIQPCTEIPAPVVSMYHASRLPDYEFQRLRVDIAEREYHVSKSAFYPKLEMVGNLGQIGFADKRNLITRSSSWHTSSFVGVRFSIPLFSMANNHNSRIGKIRLSQAKQEFMHYEERQRAAYMQQTISLQSSWETLHIQKEKLRLAEENLRLSSQRIENGVIDMLQFKQVQQDLTEEQNKYNQVKTNYIKHYVEVIYLQNR